MRSTRSTVTFSNPFTLSGYLGDLPAGDYEVLVEEELLQGLSFEAYRRTATYLTVRGCWQRNSEHPYTEGIYDRTLRRTVSPAVDAVLMIAYRLDPEVTRARVVTAFRNQPPVSDQRFRSNSRNPHSGAV